MGGNGSDQGGRWSIGLWFALVGVSAGTVASFSLIGWTFTTGLYDGQDGAEPLEFDPETVIIEAEETPENDGIAVGEDGLEGLTEPGREPDTAASPAEPRTGRVREAAEDAPEVPAEEPREEHHEVEATEPPQLVPVGEDDGECDEGAQDPDGANGWGHHWHEGSYLHPLFEEIDVDLDIDLGLESGLDPILESGLDPVLDLDSVLDLDLLD